jgi:hypothetical protein
VLREPLVLADAWLVRQVFTNPEMYLPFLPITKLVVAIVVFCLALILETSLEPPLAGPGTASLRLTLFAAGAGMIAAFVCMRRGQLSALAGFLLARTPVSHDAAQDAAVSGPLASALVHPVWAGHLGKLAVAVQQRMSLDRPKASHWPEPFEGFLDAWKTLPDKALPHIIFIQADSFCDIRRHLHAPQARLLKDFLPHWDDLHSRGRVFPLPEGAFGAYTLRTEFSALTGLHREALGPWAFNPYLLAARLPIWSLPRYLAGRGYESLLLHPYDKRFFSRDKVALNLGFQRFLSLDDLGYLPRFGPHVSDLALGKCLLEELGRSPRPLFVLLISMEAHGPWREGRLSEATIARTLAGVDYTAFCPEMQLYLCHLRHMDDLFGLVEQKKEGNGRSRPLSLWVYGDHLPSFVKEEDSA